MGNGASRAGGNVAESMGKMGTKRVIRTSLTREKLGMFVS